MSGTEYAYLAPSAFTQGDFGGRLDLATSGGSSAQGMLAHPFFFSGFVEHPAVVAQGLLLLARTARTRFYVPPNTLAAVLRAADPVVTSTPEGLRFESFSACCGVYARLDVDRAALDASHLEAGVTNVDVNPPLRQALAGLRATEPLHLSVGSQKLRVSTLAGEVVEERVPLPKRWLAGFAETQMLAASMSAQLEIPGPQIRRFVQGLPRSAAAKTVMWATRTARTVRLAAQPSPGSVCVAGPERLRVIEPMLRFATALRGYGPAAAPGSLPLPSAWVLEVPGGRVTIALSPGKSRGFSGEGAVLHSLSGAQVAGDAELLEALLNFDPRIDVARLSAAAGIDGTRVLGALNLLASSGQVGFDLALGTYFHRPLPVRAESLDEVNPRLRNARRLVEAGAVAANAATSGDEFTVRSAGVPYTVRISQASEEDRCTCPWYAKHRGTRGPCKHVLAARIASGRTAS